VSAARTIADYLANARRLLETHSTTPSLDSQLLMMKALGATRAWVIAHPEATPTPSQQAAFEHDLEQVASGAALPYVLGYWEFFGRPFFLTPDVLIPRPETEVMVTAALRWLEGRPVGQRVVDVGCGSGCIVISLALDMPDHTYEGVDVSGGALDVAKRNAERYGLAESLVLIQTDLLAERAGPFDLVCANLPYIPSGRLAELDVGSKEPALALDGGEDGLAEVERLIAQLDQRLAPGGRVLLELDPDQMERAGSLMQESLPGVAVDTVRDLSGRERVLIADRGGPE
jgi:release factor glutamine methyltransferase